MIPSPEKRHAERSWYDREGSRRQFLSSQMSDMYLPHYFQDVLSDSTATRIGIAALSSLLVTASEAYGPLFFVVVACWATDMIFGLSRVLKESLKPAHERREAFRWSRTGDGFLRLIVIIAVPGLLAMVGSVSSEILVSFVDVGPEFEGLVSGGLATFTLSWLLVHEFIGVLNNAASLHPGMGKVRDRFNGLTKVRRGE